MICFIQMRNGFLFYHCRFTEIFVSEHTEKGDLGLVVNCYLPDQPSDKVDSIVDFYLKVRKCAVEVLSDGSGNRPHYRYIV